MMFKVYLDILWQTTWAVLILAGFFIMWLVGKPSVKHGIPYPVPKIWYKLSCNGKRACLCSELLHLVPGTDFLGMTGVIFVTCF